MTLRFFTSDLHIGHERIIGFCDRPFFTVTQMNEALIERWNWVVGDDDEVWVLGDFCMPGHLEEALGELHRFNGRKVLVPGNHDKVWKGHEKRRVPDSMYLDAGFSEIIHGDLGMTTIKILDYDVNVSHFPYGPTGRYDHRYAAWHHDDDGKWLLHGHIHSPQRIYEHQIHIGVDAWGWMPVSEAELLAIMEGHPLY